MVTIKMVAERCGLSIAAVSKALNGLPGVSPENAEMVRRVAREMGYVPNAAARTLRMSRSYNIGVIYKNDLTHEFFSQVLDSFRQEMEKKKYDITFLSNEIYGVGYYQHAIQRQCDGIIIVQGSYSPDSLEELFCGNIPVIAIDQIYGEHAAVVSDNITSMQEVIAYLYGKGHRRIAFIHGDDIEVTHQRMAGFYKGCKDCGILVPPEYVVGSSYLDVEKSAWATGKLLDLETPPTCILYPDDLSYLGGLREISRRGLSVPEDISCFGYDGICMAGMLRPRLATYRQAAGEIGRQAAEQMICAIESPEKFVPRQISIAGAIQEGDTVKPLLINQ